jgi:hypothetical protein
LLSRDLATFFANNENFEDKDDDMVNEDDYNSGLDNTFVRGRPKKPDLQYMTLPLQPWQWSSTRKIARHLLIANTAIVIRSLKTIMTNLSNTLDVY